MTSQSQGRLCTAAATIAAALAISNAATAQFTPFNFQVQNGGLAASSTAGGFGFELATAFAGDFDADGFDDYIVGNPITTTPAGAAAGIVRVYNGQDGSLLLTVPGTPGTNFGFSVAAAGDVNSDGYDDIIVGAPQGGGTPGRVFLFSSQTPANPMIINEATIGLTNGARLGHSVSGAGDVNGDGIPDVIVGAPFHNAGRGAAVVFAGGSAQVLGLIVGNNISDNLGWSVSGAGDLDGDLRDEVIIGAPRAGGSSNPGEAYVYKFDQITNSMVLLRTLVHPQPQSFANFGFSVSSCGDVNDDGIFDVVVGAPQHGPFFSATGSAVVFSGDASSTVLNTSSGAPGSQFGYSVCGVGDGDGDNFDDWAVGAPANVDGTVSLFRGSLTGGAAAGTIGSIAGSNSRFGSSLAGSVARLGGSSASDTAGSGFDRILIAARDANSIPLGSGFGRVYLYGLNSSGQSPSHETFRWVGCGRPTATPRIQYRGHLRNQSNLQIGLHGADPNAPAALLIGTPTTLDLTPIGAPGCWLLVNQTIPIPPLVTDAGGRTSITLPMGNACQSGLPFSFQWAIISNPLAPNALGVVTSNALDCQCR